MIWRTKVHSNTKDGVTWQGWDEWELNFGWVGFGWYSEWMDGPYKSLRLGFVSVGYCWNNNYIEAHRKAGK